MPNRASYRLCGLLLVDARQGGSVHLGAAQMIELAGLCLEVADHIAQVHAPGELVKAQADELRPAGHLAQPSVLMMLPSQGLEFMSRNQFEYL